MLMPQESAEDSEAGRLWLLAGEAAKVLRDPSDRERRERLLNNAYSAVQAYEADPAHLPGMLHRTSQDAFEAAFAACWPSLGRQDAVEALVVRMRAVGFPGDGVDPIPDPEAAAFFERVRDAVA